MKKKKKVFFCISSLPVAAKCRGMVWAPWGFGILHLDPTLTVKYGMDIQDVWGNRGILHTTDVMEAEIQPCGTGKSLGVETPALAESAFAKICFFGRQSSGSGPKCGLYTAQLPAFPTHLCPPQAERE